MDPLSIIASVAGVATAGASLVTVLFDTVDAYRNAPKEISSIARSIQDLSIILDQLVAVLSDAQELHTRLLRKSILSAVRQIDDVHEEVWELIEHGESGFGRVKWTFRKSKMRGLLAKIEAQKSTVQLASTMLLLAIQQKRVARSKEKNVVLFARRRLRRQAENLVNAAHQSLLDLTQSSEPAIDEDQPAAVTSSASKQVESREQGNAKVASPTTPTIIVSRDDISDDRPPRFDEDTGPNPVSRRDPETAALWLYNIVFSRTVEKHANRPENVISGTPDSSNALVIRNQQGNDIVLAQRPFATQVVEDLLYDWTYLSECEVKEASERGSRESPGRYPRTGRSQPEPPKEASPRLAYSPSRSDRRASSEDPRGDTNRLRRQDESNHMDELRKRDLAEAAIGGLVANRLLTNNRKDRPARDDFPSDQKAGITPEARRQRPRAHSDTGPAPQRDERSRRATVEDYSKDSDSLRRSKSSSGRRKPRSGDGERATDVEYVGSRSRARDRRSPRVSDEPSRSRSRDGDTSRKIRQAAMASLIAGATEAFRVSKEPGSWQGEKTKRILTAAAGASAVINPRN